MVAHTIQTDQARANYNAEEALIYVAYSGILTADVPLAIYSWLEELYDEIDIDSLYGQIFDFRDVKEFDDSNLKTARRTSNRMNMRVDVSHVPVALIVGDPYHQEILLGSMRISPDHARKKIVWSDEEAREFFEKWHAEREK